MNISNIDRSLKKNKGLIDELLLNCTMTLDAAIVQESLRNAVRVEQLKDCLIEFIRMMKEVEYNMTILEKLKEKFEKDGTLKYSVEEYFSKKLSIMKAKEDREFYKKHDKYKSFTLRVWQVHHPNEPLPDNEDGDEDIMVYTQQSEVSTTCPLTQSDFVEPMKSDICQHTFSKEAILSYLKNQRRKCPVAGCGETITKDSLVPDREMVRNLNKKQNMRQVTRTNTKIIDI